MKKRTTESFKKELSEINPNIEVLGEYVKVHLKVLYKCKVCGHEWNAEPNSVLHGIGCPECGKRKCHESNKTGLDKLIKQLEEKNSTVEYYSGTYVNTDTKLFFKCKRCGNIWEATPHSILAACKRSVSGNGCPKCKGKECSKRKTKSHKQFIDEMYKVNPNIEIISKYIKDKMHVKCRCLKCNFEWEAFPNHLLRNHGCPKCQSSIGERLVRDWLNSHNIEYSEQYKIEYILNKNTHNAYIDFMVKCKNKIYFIEYNGRLHYEYISFLHKGDIINFEKLKDRDLKVREYCKDNNIELIEIPYSANKIENIDQYLNFIIENNNDK